MPERARHERTSAERAFFPAMALLIALTVFVGFYPTYYLMPVLGKPDGPLPMTPLVHVHGALFTSWIVLLAVQTALITTRRTGVHRKLGVFGACVAGAMVFVGSLTAIYGMARGSGPPGIDPARFLAIPLFDMVVFGVLATAGIVLRRDTQTHKRLMLLATIGILPAAIARWPLAILQAGPIAFFGINDLYLVPLVAFDVATRGRLHRATLWGSLVILLSQPLRLVISGTDIWVRFAEAAGALVK